MKNILHLLKMGRLLSSLKTIWIRAELKIFWNICLAIARIISKQLFIYVRQSQRQNSDLMLLWNQTILISISVGEMREKAKTDSDTKWQIFMKVFWIFSNQSIILIILMWFPRNNLPETFILGILSVKSGAYFFNAFCGSWQEITLLLLQAHSPQQ